MRPEASSLDDEAPAPKQKPLTPKGVSYSDGGRARPARGGRCAGTQFALSFPAGFPDSGRVVRWQTIFGTAPTAVNLSLQGAMADVDAEYQNIDSSTSTAGEARTVTGVSAKFLRIKFNSSTGGAGLTAKILV